MRRLIWLASLAPLCGGCSQQPQAQVEQSFCVQYANTTGFGGDGRVIVFTATDSSSSSDPNDPKVVTYVEIGDDGRPIVGENGQPAEYNSFTMNPPDNVSSPFASRVLRMRGVPPIQFTANLQANQSGGELQATCAIPQVTGLGGEMNLTNPNVVWRVEVDFNLNLACVDDQGTCSN